MNILFLGGDTRYKFMMKDLSKRHSVSYVGFNDIDFKALRHKYFFFGYVKL